MNREAIGGTVITSSFDYLKPEFNRPDLFEERTTFRSGISRKTAKQDIGIGITLMTVILSAFIFTSIVSWADIIRIYYDSLVVNDIITPLVASRFYFAVTATFITLIVAALFWYIYINIRPEPE